MPDEASIDPTLIFHKIDDSESFPEWAPHEELVRFFNETMRPYHDTAPDVDAGLRYALDPSRDGFIMAVRDQERLLGALTMLDTGMGGYVPRWLMLFVSVQPDTRGRGIGRALIDRALAECDGPVKLHVEYDNPAKRLYERVGFTSKYAEMRWSPDK